VHQQKRHFSLSEHKYFADFEAQKDFSSKGSDVLKQKNVSVVKLCMKNELTAYPWSQQVVRVLMSSVLKLSLILKRASRQKTNHKFNCILLKLLWLKMRKQITNCSSRSWHILYLSLFLHTDFIFIIHDSDTRIVWRRLIIIFQVFRIANKREHDWRKSFSADVDDIKLRMTLMKSASKLHSKSADRALWSLILLWSQHWMNAKNKAHDDDYRSLTEILCFGFKMCFTLETEIVI